MTSPLRLRVGEWLDVLKRTGKEFQEDNMTDWAAALTYYGLLSLFPAMIALVSILGLVADPKETTRALTDIVTQIGRYCRAAGGSRDGGAPFDDGPLAGPDAPDDDEEEVRR